MAIALLGPLQVDGGASLSPRDRVVVSALAVDAGRVLSADQLADALWGDEVPRSWSNILQGCVFDCEFGFSADGTLLTIRGGDGAVRLIDMDKRIQLGDALELGDQAASVALRPDGRELAFPSP